MFWHYFKNKLLQLLSQQKSVVAVVSTRIYCNEFCHFSTKAMTILHPLLFLISHFPFVYFQFLGSFQLCHCFKYWADVAAVIENCVDYNVAALVTSSLFRFSFQKLPNLWLSINNVSVSSLWLQLLLLLKIRWP